MCIRDSHKAESLPKVLVNIPLEYFATALAWMAQQPVIYADKLAGLLGGTPEGNARAASDGWSQTLRFLQKQFA